MSTLTVRHRDSAAGPVLHLTGDLDFHPLSGLAFCDSSGITALLAARQHALAAEADVVLDAVPPGLLRVLTHVGLDRVFTLRPAGARQG